MHSIDHSFMGLVQKDFILTRNAWSHVIDPSQNLLAVANQLTLIIQLTIVKQVGLSGRGTSWLSVFEVQVFKTFHLVLKDLGIICHGIVYDIVWTELKLLFREYDLGLPLLLLLLLLLLRYAFDMLFIEIFM